MIPKRINIRENNKISVFYFIIVLVILAISTAFVVHNIIYVNQMTQSTNELKESISRESQKNDFYRAEIEKLSGFERIRQLAEEKLNLKFSESALDLKNVIVVQKDKNKNY